jgi:pimeloyl-ACP methyl ester carboxylesterase
LRLITYSRPGYGGSDRHPGRTVGDCAADVAAVADELGFERFHTIGASGGGPHALACGSLLGDRVITTTVIGSVAPVDAEGLDWTAGMGEENIEEFAAVRAGPGELTEFLEREAEAMAGATGEGIVAALGDLVSAVDKRALNGAYGDYVADEFERGLAPGVSGWFDDDLAFFAGWGFDPAAIDAPVSIWHGREDRFVPITHGEWLAEHLPGAHAHLLPNHGHLSLTVTSYGEILDALLERGLAGS